MKKRNSWGAIWARAAQNSLADRAAYREDFILTLLATVVSEFLVPVTTLLMYQTGGQRGFPGWSLAEALVVQAVFLVGRGLSAPFFSNLAWIVGSLVRTGNFELILLQPRSPLLVCLTRSLHWPSTLRIIAGLVVMGWALGQLPSVSVAGWFVFVFLLGLAVLVHFGFALATSATLFLWVGNGRMSELVDALQGFGPYPLSVFPGALQAILAVVIPVAILGSLPASALLGREVSWGIPASLASIVFVGLSLAFWKLMIRRYVGAGG